MLVCSRVCVEGWEGALTSCLSSIGHEILLLLPVPRSCHWAMRDMFSFFLLFVSSCAACACFSRS